MLDLLGKLSVFLHISAGFSTLIAGPIAIFYNFRDAKKHKQAGKVFFYAMLLVCFSAFLGFLKHPEWIFYQFLLGISFIVLMGMFTGIRAMLFMKNKAQRSNLDRGIALVGLLVGIAMIMRAIYNWVEDGHLVFSVLLIVFGSSFVLDSIKSWQRWINFSSIPALTWYKVHINNMIGCFTASTTAFTVNMGKELPWVIQWFGPMLLLMPIGFYFNKKLNERRVKHNT